ncbi:hypothetical protein J1N35_004495 [Gossypium stocksii]|uniref:DUF4371 domain-containing protein n=1 Tax=Gossypium stocksii TaxID=47602 RepID=A0A9D3WE83_9ROSI|nr:hypothetical protein J1N35_004495 [Gossypium stocksii]
MLSSGLYFEVVPLGDAMKYKLQEIEFIWEDIGDPKFCIMVDETRDESKKKMETRSLALEKAICEVLLCHCLNVGDIHGQGYDGASNMRGEWNDFQALFATNFRFAYYVHYLAYHL